MSVKYICDGCGKDTIANYRGSGNHKRMKFNNHDFCMAFSVAVDGSEYSGEVCWSCLIKLFTEGK